MSLASSGLKSHSSGLLPSIPDRMGSYEPGLLGLKSHSSGLLSSIPDRMGCSEPGLLGLKSHSSGLLSYFQSLVTRQEEKLFNL